MRLEKVDRLGNRLEHAAGFRLERERYRLALAPFEIDEVGHVRDHLARDGLLVPRRPVLEGAGNGADAACLAVGQQFAHRVGKCIGIGKADRIGPIGLVGILLDLRAVEGAVGKSVEGHDFGPGLREERLQFLQRARLAQRL